MEADERIASSPKAPVPLAPSGNRVATTNPERDPVNLHPRPDLLPLPFCLIDLPDHAEVVLLDHPLPVDQVADQIARGRGFRAEDQIGILSAEGL